MERKGWIEAEWGVSELGRRAKFYRLTPRGRRQLATETAEWTRFAADHLAAAGGLMRFSAWPWKPRLDDEVDDELAFHIEMRTRELVERGMTPAAARREAERRFGNVARVRETCRELGKGRDRHMRRATYLAELRQDSASPPAS